MNGYCKLLLKAMNDHEWELTLGKTIMSVETQIGITNEILRLKELLKANKVNVLGTFSNTEFGVVKTWRLA